MLRLIQSRSRDAAQMAKGKATPATEAARRAGIAHEVIALDLADAYRAGKHGYGERVAEALGVNQTLVCKTLVVRVDGQPTIAVVPIHATLDLKALARVCGGRRAALADAADAERLTGYVIGAISPLGQRRRLPTFVDTSVAAEPVLYVSGGRRGLELALSATDLLAMTAAATAQIAR